MPELERTPDGIPLENRHVAQIVDTLTGRRTMPTNNPVKLTKATGRALLQVSPTGGTQVTNADATNPGLDVRKSDGTTQQILTTDAGVTIAGPVTSSSGDTADVKMSARTADYDLWLLCDGRPIPRAGTVTIGGVAQNTAALFAAIGVKFGAGNGTTTFNIPDCRGFFPIGADPTNAAGRGTYAVGAVGGALGHAHSGDFHYHDHHHDMGHGHTLFDHNHVVNGAGGHGHPAGSGSSNLNFTDLAGGGTHFSAQGGHGHDITVTGVGDHIHATQNATGIGTGSPTGGASPNTAQDTTGPTFTSITGTDATPPPYQAVSFFIHL